MGFAVCGINLNLVMESGTRKGREAYFEPSQFHGLFSFMGGLKMKSKVDVKRRCSSGPVTAQIEPPKPKVMTKDELHRELDNKIQVAQLLKSDTYMPVIIHKFEYDNFFRTQNISDGIKEDLKREISWLKKDVAKLQELLEYAKGQRTLDEINDPGDRLHLGLNDLYFPGRLHIDQRKKGNIQKPKVIHGGLYKAPGEACIDITSDAFKAWKQSQISKVTGGESQEVTS